MKKVLILLPVLVLILTGSVSAQRITAEKTFGLNYPVSTMGYPTGIVANKDDRFSVIEYWNNDLERKFANYYVQTYSDKFEEVWFKPVTKDGDPRLTAVTDLIRLDGAVGVIGTQFSPAIKRQATKLQLWDLDGHDRGGLQTISTYTKKAKKGYEEVIAYSPDKKSLFWMGHNPGASYKKRDFFCSVTDDSGTKIWGKRLLLEPTLQKYLVKQATIDNRGNAYFYMVYETATNTVKDTVHQPMIVRYVHKESKFYTYALDLPGVSVPEGMIKITDSGDLAFVGILSDGSEKGFLNGANKYSTPLKWNKIVYQLFDIKRELVKSQEFIMDLPDALVTRYKERGADFTKSELREDKGQLYWVMEEFYIIEHNDKPQHRYYDIATVAIDLKSGAIKWANSFEKKQRDYYRGELLGYVCGIAEGQIHFVYLNERGAQGKIVCSSFDLKTGEVTHKDLARNERENNLFFPRRSTMVGPNKMMLLGVGNVERNEFKLIEVSFD
ncbi:MAG: hypothetical protein IPN95_17380 [Bacteroidetes bacterium]|nr:hypothetical protein [Bacteroidota bacterium]